jgi:integrase
MVHPLFDRLYHPVAGIQGAGSLRSGAAGLPYFHPHSFRHTLAALGERICKTPEEFKAWSQNLGHEKVLTTFTSYGAVTESRQGEILLGLGAGQKEANTPKLPGDVDPATFEAAIALARLARKPDPV